MPDGLFLTKQDLYNTRQNRTTPPKIGSLQWECISNTSQVPNCRAIGGPGGASPWRSPRRGPRRAAGGKITGRPAPHLFDVGVEPDNAHPFPVGIGS